jgi:hypothetical protein
VDKIPRGIDGQDVAEWKSSNVTMTLLKIAKQEEMSSLASLYFHCERSTDPQIRMSYERVMSAIRFVKIFSGEQEKPSEPGND